MSSGPSAGGGLYVPRSLTVSHRNRNLAIVLVVIVAVAAVAGAYFLGVFGSSKQAWKFDGAYGTYSGETTYLTVTFNFTIRAQVVDFNSSAVQILVYYTLKYGTHTDTNQSTRWDPLAPNGSISFAGPLGWTLSRTYDTTRFVSGATYACKAYEYTKGSTVITSYVDKSVGFPVEFTYAATPVKGSTISIDLPLVQTNISGL